LLLFLSIILDCYDLVISSLSRGPGELIAF
jgi:hypothetical protein